MKVKSLLSDSRFDQKGFTIIELLIATGVFSLVMLILMFGVVQITNTYYKGLSESKTQDTARNILNDVAESIQLGGNVSSLSTESVSVDGQGDTVTIDAYCIGNQEYDFMRGFELKSSGNDFDSDQTANATRLSGSCTDPPQNLWSGANLSGQELLENNMRLANLTITSQGNNLYKIDVRVVYGDNDVLTAATAADAKCQGGAGDQFCGSAQLTTIVQQRVQ